MTRHVRAAWPDPRPFVARGGRPIRILALSDESDRALDHQRNRDALEPLDGLVGCGDLDAEYLAFVADAFPGARLIYVRGNHDRGHRWGLAARRLPEPLASGHRDRLAGLSVMGLEWPGIARRNRTHDERGAWREVIRAALGDRARALAGRSEPILVVSHVAPAGLGDLPNDPYHRGFRGYRWLADRARPPLWIHGHTPVAEVGALSIAAGPTLVLNATGSVLVEVVGPEHRSPM